MSPLSTVCILHLQKGCEACQSLNEKATTLAFYIYSSLGKLEIPVYFNHTWLILIQDQRATLSDTDTERDMNLQAPVSIWLAVLTVAACSCCLSALQILADKAWVFLDLVHHATSLWEIPEEGFLGNCDESRSTAAKSQTDLALKALHFTCEEAVWGQLCAVCQLEVKHHQSTQWTDLVGAPCLAPHKTKMTLFKSLIVFNFYFIT